MRDKILSTKVPLPVVYFFYNCNWKLLYVGVTGCFNNRWTSHMKSEKNLSLVKYVQLNVFDCMPDALFYEANSILKMSPIWNQRGVDGDVSKHVIDPVSCVWLDTV